MKRIHPLLLALASGAIANLVLAALAAILAGGRHV